MIQSLVIYGLLIIVMYLGGRKAEIRQMQYPDGHFFLSPEVFIPIIVFAFFSGVRYDVGVDHLAYVNEYEHLRIFGEYKNIDYDIGYNLVMFLFTRYQIHYVFFFLFLSFIQVVFIFWSFREERQILIYVGILLLLSFQYFFLMNGIKQGIAFCIFLYAIKFILERRVFLYVLAILLASTIHTSALLLLPVYLFNPDNEREFMGAKLQLLLVAITVYLGSSSIIHDFLNGIDIKFITGIDFIDNSIKNTTLRTMQDIEFNRLTWGPTRIIEMLLNIFLILNSKQLIYWGSNRVKLIYVLYFISILLEAMFFKFHGIMRIILYFSMLRFVIFSYLLYFLLREKRTTAGITTGLAVLALFLMIFSIRIYMADSESHILYQFFWEAN